MKEWNGKPVKSGIVRWIRTETKLLKSSMRMVQRKLSEVETLHSYLGQAANIISHCLDCMEVDKENKL